MCDNLPLHAADRMEDQNRVLPVTETQHKMRGCCGRWEENENRRRAGGRKADNELSFMEVSKGIFVVEIPLLAFFSSSFRFGFELAWSERRGRGIKWRSGC